MATTILRGYSTYNSYLHSLNTTQPFYQALPDDKGQRIQSSVARIDEDAG
jgi:hypothetical protein